MNALNKLTEGKVLDVSKIKLDGSGTRAIKAPTRASSTKRSLPELPTIYSDNLIGYQRALRILGPEYERYVQKFASQYGERISSEQGLANPQAARNKLISAINKARKDRKAVDVSKIEPSGTGARIINAPTYLSNKRAVNGLPEIVSDNFAGYQTALNILGPEYAGYADQFASQYGTGAQVSGAVPRSPASLQGAIDPQAAYLRLHSAIRNAADQGKVLDVSKIKENGTGARIGARPSGSGTTRRSVQGMPVVSNNYEAYRRAMSILGQEYLPYADQFLAAYGPNEITRAPATPKAKSPARSTAKFGAPIGDFPMTPGIELITIDPDGTPRSYVPRQQATGQTYQANIPLQGNAQMGGGILNIPRQDNIPVQGNAQFYGQYNPMYQQGPQSPSGMPQRPQSPSRMGMQQGPQSPSGMPQRPQSPSRMQQGLQSPSRMGMPPPRVVTPPPRVATPPRVVTPPRVTTPPGLQMPTRRSNPEMVGTQSIQMPSRRSNPN